MPNEPTLSRRVFLPAAAWAALCRARVARAAPHDAAPHDAAPHDAAPDAAARAILAERTGERWYMGAVAGVLDARGGTRVVGTGRLSEADGRAPDADTVFEIGSVTKVFTALLLADAAARGEVGLDDPVRDHLPAPVRVPGPRERPITLLDLASYGSGLPRNPRDPDAAFVTARLYEFLARYEPPRAPGAGFEYSNMAFGLLGLVLSHRVGLEYEELVLRRICAPLGLESTRVAPTPAMRARLAPGHDAVLEPAPPWPHSELAGSGALRSTARDVLAFLAAASGAHESPLAPAFASLLRVRRPTDAPGSEVAMGWFVQPNDGREVVWKDGATRGYQAFAGFSPAGRHGAVVLANTLSWASVDDIGQHLIEPAARLAALPRRVPADPARLAGLAGAYKLSPRFSLAVTARGDRLFCQGTGQSEFELFAEDDLRFFARATRARVVFLRDDTGRATRLVLFQNGQRLPGVRE